MDEVIEFLKALEPLLEPGTELWEKYSEIDIYTLISEWLSGEKGKYLIDIAKK